jgi:hypothetical protein
MARPARWFVKTGGAIGCRLAGTLGFVRTCESGTSMTVYLAIRSDAKHSCFIPPSRLEEEIRLWPELKKVEATLFEVIRAGASCAWLNTFACSPDGSYAVFQDDTPPEKINLIELRYPYEECEHAAWFGALAVRVAQSLGWEAWGSDDDGNDFQLWSPSPGDSPK